MRNNLMVFVCTGLITLLSGCGDSREVQLVKAGSLQSCPGVTLEKMVNGFMNSPDWESGTSEQGQHFVNITGGITLKEKPVTAKIQFLVDVEKGSFQFNAFEMNDIPQVNLMALGLLNKMCESAQQE
jgi:hypothetical protein